MEGNKNLWKKPVKQYNPGYPRVEKKLYEQFYGCESYHNPCPTCKGTCNTFLGSAKR